MATSIPIERTGAQIRASACTCRLLPPRRLHVVCRGTQASDKEQTSKNLQRRALMMSATLISVVGKGDPVSKLRRYRTRLLNTLLENSELKSCPSHRQTRVLCSGAGAVGIEALPAPEAVESKYEEMRRRNKVQLDKSTEAFEKSDILRTLRERTDANKEK